MAQCTATSRRSGNQCRAQAVLGATVCKMYGGSAPQVKAAAQRRLAEAKLAAAVAQWGGRLDVNPAEALLELVQTKAAEVAYWRGRTDELEPNELAGLLIAKTEQGTGPQGPVDTETRQAGPHVYVLMLHKAEDALAKYAEAAIRAGATQVMVDMAKAQGAATIEDFRRVIHLARSQPETDVDDLILALLED